MFIPDSRTLKKTGFQMPSIRQMSHKEVKVWVDNDKCKGHRISMLRLFIRVKIYRLIKDKNENWRKPKAWSQTRRDLRNQ
jgi:hypothetical protein